VYLSYISAPKCLSVFALSIALTLLLPFATASGQEALQHDGRTNQLQEIDGPLPPISPNVISRDETGRITGRAVRLAAPLQMDGRLTESIYETLPSMTDFIQNDPNEGEPASEKTEVWIFFDDEYVYLSARCWESQPDRMIANEMRRDNRGIAMDDNLAWSFDTFYDRRNAMLFEVNALGGRMDAQTSNEGMTNFDWNPIWQVEVHQFEGGWSVETAMPFKSLRYRPGSSQIWGFNLRRRNRWKNEMSYMQPVSAALGPRGLRPALLAPLVGIEAPPKSINLDVKPYVIADLSTDYAASPPFTNDLGGTAGLEIKYGLTENMTADFSYNTDFAQVEADDQQVNLSRFNLFFPEKREFFLENRRTFEFGGESRFGYTPVLFFSRRIGLQGGREVPVQVGGRLTGRVGEYDLGILHMKTDEEIVAGAQPTNFSVLRVKRDIFQASSIGVLMTNRSINLQGTGANSTYGIDGGFSFLKNLLTIDSYYARTQTNGLSGTSASYRTHVEYDGDRYGFEGERLAIGDAFNPEVGFVRRTDMYRNFAKLRFSPRLLSVNAIRKLSWGGDIDYIENGKGQLETREGQLSFGIEFENSDDVEFTYKKSYEFLPKPFEISSGIVLPVAGYNFESMRAELNFGPQRMFSGHLHLEHGSFYNGQRTKIRFRNGRIKLFPGFSIEPKYEVNWIDLPVGKFSTHLPGSRVTYTMTPLMFLSALLQYSSASHTVDTNFRFRWEYQPGSELFIVYNEQQGTLENRFDRIDNRALIVKLTRLFRF
tara:strand:+ start:19966 stop:22269 length:2304 start_codon:yes stop_codon:yes gene_type:complete